CGKPWSVSDTVDLGIANDCKCTRCEQTTQIAIALFADATESWLASARALLRHQPNPGREVSPGSECPRLGNASNKRGGESRADTGNLIKSSARLAGSVPDPDHAVEF